MSRLPAIDPRDLRDHADPARIERVWRRVSRDLPGGSDQRPVRSTGVAGVRFGSRAILWAACLAGVFGAGLFVGSVQLSTSTTDETGAERLDAQLTDVFAAGTRQRTFPLPGGGRLVLQPESLMEVVEVRDGSVRLHLLRGRASVDASTSDMSFAVVAGDALTLAPAGSVVSFSRLDTDVDVAVDRGSVEVVSATGRQVVRKGERSRVPIVATAVTSLDPQLPPHQVVANTPPHTNDRNDPDRASKDPSVTPPDGEVAVITPPPVEQTPTWMTLYNQDKFTEAMRALEERGGIAQAIASSQSASEIMSLGEVALFNKKNDLWITSRRRVADEFPSDPNASIAAVQLADTLDRMGQRDLAAKYRAQAMQSSRLFETVLCKQLVNAPKDTAEERRKAAAIATDYLSRFPTGTCTEDAKGVIEDSKADPEPEPKKADPKKDEPKKAEDAKKPEEGKKADESKKDAPEGSSPP
ncbi:MAG: hypothetical protein HOV80_27720 [Polyangiaceae bacterium]|nr:hypothetical protein [Polyangiaceae bacterium]